MDKRVLSKLIKSGWSTYKIAEYLEKSQTSVRYWLKKYNIPTNKRPRNIRIGNKTKKYDVMILQKLINQGHTYRSLYKKIGISHSTLSNYVKHGLIQFRTLKEIGDQKYKQNGRPFTKSQCSAGGKKGGGYREKSGRSKGGYVKDSFEKITYLQSSLEIKCADFLNSQKIRWIRPKPIRYTLGLKQKLYYPDFYLVDYDIYLDPKNNFLAERDQKKIELVKTQNNIRIFILKQENITLEYFNLFLRASSLAT